MNVFENNISHQSSASQYEQAPADLIEEGTGTFAAGNKDGNEQVLLGGTFNAGKQRMAEMEDDDEEEEEEDERELARIERVLKD